MNFVKTNKKRALMLFGIVNVGGIQVAVGRFGDPQKVVFGEKSVGEEGVCYGVNSVLLVVVIIVAVVAWGVGGWSGIWFGVVTATTIRREVMRTTAHYSK